MTGIRVITDHPIAYESFDHQQPHGTAQDNTHYPWFVTKTQRIFSRKVRMMDLGCAGGGLVKDFIDMNHFAIGIEGSDYSKKNKRAEWAMIPDNLFTADITKPFTVVDDENKRIMFDVITAWEVMEHIKREDLPGLFKNITDHLVTGGLFVCSVATFPDAGYHVTLEEKPWWTQQFKDHGLEPVEGIYGAGDYVRESSFYITARKT